VLYCTNHPYVGVCVPCKGASSAQESPTSVNTGLEGFVWREYGVSELVGTPAIPLMLYHPPPPTLVFRRLWKNGNGARVGGGGGFAVS
jgi:hypothetical protein